MSYRAPTTKTYSKDVLFGCGGGLCFRMSTQITIFQISVLATLITVTYKMSSRVVCLQPFSDPHERLTVVGPPNTARRAKNLFGRTRPKDTGSNHSAPGFPAADDYFAMDKKAPIPTTKDPGVKQHGPPPQAGVSLKNPVVVP